MKKITKAKANPPSRKASAGQGKKIVPKKITMKVGKLVGTVSHYFSDISVGVLKLSAPIVEGDEIRIMGGENTDFNQIVKSMQVDHEPLKKAKKGDDVGLKVKEKVREGYKVYKV